MSAHEWHEICIFYLFASSRERKGENSSHALAKMSDLSASMRLASSAISL